MIEVSNLSVRAGGSSVGGCGGLAGARTRGTLPTIDPMAIAIASDIGKVPLARDPFEERGRMCIPTSG